MDGILPLWKPKGFTSHDCVSKARGMLRMKKIGHTGTLDPDVEGVLPLCVGKATKIVPFLTDTDKVYEAVVTLGYSTDTEDAGGNQVETLSVDKPVDKTQIKETLRSFEGRITQTPPMYSAVKVNGRRLYEYAREGKVIERPTRHVTIKEIALTSVDESVQNGTFSFSFRAVCSKGTYIRTLCVDIGKALGFPAHMSSLVRTKTGGIEKGDCYTFDQLQEAADEGRISEFLLPLQRGLTHLPVLEVTEAEQAMIANGRVLEEPDNFSEDVFVVSRLDTALAIYQKHPEKPGKIKPVRVF
ncbi:tRNA pseudouridine(55) synthase TruB [Halobacillus sp. ACCC02827]|uniref:tRNA pseudouridine(55) synthase TruB n=1 Tax=Bacillaceae TaxID=186817 RepID=UPI0002A4F0A7|nr:MULTISPECIES: tRNA pseudouridine(55) synthase TruB [Bacillaceae]ELK44788.1 tRNA pseudouridine 55 synthase [Halobacillus sp. BAB-2008]QHT46699.1 tRNA pseudouridine(55) synthase TruB [Bacillus sp. SB49]WJE17510.1 tRNA pseudouridine(55) synthase TruB [Halobacillus sp. ACCC02827]